MWWRNLPGDDGWFLVYLLVVVALLFIPLVVWGPL